MAKKTPLQGFEDPLQVRASEEMHRSLILEKLPAYFLIFGLLTVLYFLFQILQPFVTVIFLGAVLAIAFYPAYTKFSLWLRGYNRVASLLSCLFVVLVIVAPMTFFILLLTSEAVDTYEVVQDKLESGVFDKYLQWEDGGFFYDLKQQVEPVVDLESLDVKKSIVSMAQNLSSYLVSQSANFIKGVSGVLLSLIVMLFCMYYFFKDGPMLVKKVGVLSPLPSVYENELFKKIGAMVKAVIFGVFFTALIQGLVGGIGFAIAGVSSPVFWGTAMAFFSLMPVVGTAIIWVPAAIIILILGDYGHALFIFLWGLFAVGSVDNILRPYLIGGKVHTYPLMMFLVILGGVITIGLKGVVIGPLVLIILMSFLHIYEAEYSRVLKK